METQSVLTPEEEALFKKLEAKKKAQLEKTRDDRKALKALEVEMVKKHLPTISELSALLSDVKYGIFADFATLIDERRRLYAGNPNQKTYTFSDNDGGSILMGYKTVTRFDDTANEGFALISKYLESLSENDDNKARILIINKALRRDKEGNRDPKKVLDLLALVDEIDNPMFTDGAKIILDAKREENTKLFIEARRKNGIQETVSIPLSITTAKFPEGQTVDLHF